MTKHKDDIPNVNSLRHVIREEVADAFSPIRLVWAFAMIVLLGWGLGTLFC